MTAWLTAARHRIGELVAIFTASFAVSGAASFLLWMAWVFTAPLGPP